MLLTDTIFCAALLAVAVVWFSPTGRNRHRVFVMVSMAMLLLGGVLFLQGRWQVVPGSGAVLLLSALYWPGHRSMPRWSRRKKMVCSAAGGVTLLAGGLLSCALLYGMPPFQLPQPAGPYAIGVRDFEVTDPAREEAFTPDPADKRRIAVRAWYPAAADAAGPFRPYRNKAEADFIGREFAGAMNLPAYVFDHLRMSRTHGRENAAVLAGAEKFPLLVFSHGYFGWVDTNTALMEALASSGYVVLSISHPYESSGVIYPNGDRVALDPSVVNQRHTRETLPFTKILMVSTDPAERFAATRDMYSLSWQLTESLPVWREDILSVVEAFVSGRVDAGMLDLVARTDVQRRGYFGMSFGGPAATHACEADPQCDAAVNLDGRDVSLGLFNTPVRAPLLMLYQDNPLFPSDLRYNDFHYESVSQAGLREDIARIILKDASHWDYTDYTLIARWPAYPYVIPLGVKGPVAGQRQLQVVGDFVVTFFDHYVAGKNTRDMDQLLATHPEARRQDLSSLRSWRRNTDSRNMDTRHTQTQ